MHSSKCRKGQRIWGGEELFALRQSVCLSLAACPWTDKVQLLLLHLAASDDLMGCFIFTSHLLHCQCSTFNPLIFWFPLRTYYKYTSTTLNSHYSLNSLHQKHRGQSQNIHTGHNGISIFPEFVLPKSVSNTSEWERVSQQVHQSSCLSSLTSHQDHFHAAMTI